MTANTKTRTDFSTGEVGLVNTNFSLIFNDWWKIQRVLIDEYPTALKIFSWLIQVADKSNSVIVSLEAIGLGVNLHVRTCQRAIGYLKEKNFIRVLKTGNMNIYVLNDQIIWKDTADKKNKYSQFSAKVHIIASEQEEEYKTELIGHAVKKVKKTSKKRQIDPSKAINEFEIIDILPSNIKEFIKKGYVYVGETDNAYELNDKKGILTIIPK